METIDDTSNYLQAVAQYVSLIHTNSPSVSILLNNYQLLHQYVQQIKIDWHKIASDLGTNRNKIYHWYYETHLRHLAQDRIEKEDKIEMTKLIIDGIISRRIVEPTFQSYIKQQVFGNRDVHRADFSMTYNNIIRTKNIKEMIIKHNIQLPAKRAGQSNLQSRAVSPGNGFVHDVNPVPIIPDIFIPQSVPAFNQSQQQKTIQAQMFSAFHQHKFVPLQDQEVSPFLNTCPTPQLETRELSIEPQSFEFMSFQDDAVDTFPWDQLTSKLQGLKK